MALTVRQNAFADERGRRVAPCGHPVPCGCDEDAVPFVEKCCGECWLPDCRNALPGGLKILLRQVRAERIRALAPTHTRVELASIFRVSKRSIYRILEDSHDAAQP